MPGRKTAHGRLRHRRGPVCLQSGVDAKVPRAFDDDEAVEAEDPSGARLCIPTFTCRGHKMEEHSFEGVRFLDVDLALVEQKVGLRADLVFGVNAMLGKRWLIDRQKSIIEMQ
jgi:hypothetical protein